MTRHELKDGKWYLVRYSQGEFFEILKQTPGLFNGLNTLVLEENKKLIDEEGVEWVEIDPELAFKLFDKPDEWLEKLSSVSSNARGVPHGIWIKCSERLPEDGQWVWTNIMEDLCYSRQEGGWCGGDGDYRAITHWMPLPETPKDSDSQ